MGDEDPTWYVLRTDAGWLVTERTRGGRRVFPTKEVAIAAATELARAAAPAGYQVRRANGTIEREVRFGRSERADPLRRNLPTPPDAPSSKQLIWERRLLLVDDDPLIRSSFGRLLSSRGWEMIFAEDCAEAQRALATDTVFAAIIDLGLPDSVELAKGLSEAQRASRIVFFTGYVPDGLRAQAEAIGVVVIKGASQNLLEALGIQPQAAPENQRERASGP